MGFITNIKSLGDIPTFNVEKEQLFDSLGHEVPNTYSIMRSDTRQHFGTCSDKYRPIQLDEMFDIVQTASDRVGGINHTGYTYVGDGKRMVIRSEIEGDLMVGDNDKIDGLVYTVIENTGISSNRLIPSTMRIACTNALHLVSAKASGLKTSLRHSNNFDENVQDFIGGLTNNIQTIVNFKERVDRMREAKFSKDEMAQLTAIMLPEPKEREPSTRLIHKREKIVDLFENGRGNGGKTKWDALNAFTEFETHQKFSPEKFVRTLSTSTLSNKALKHLDAVYV